MKKIYCMAVAAVLSAGLCGAAVFPKPAHMECSGKRVPVDALKVECRADKSLPAEGYRLQIEPSGKVLVEYSDDDGLFYAQKTLSAVKSDAVDGKVACCKITDAPAIPLRGVVEGYYGRPWGAKGRISLVEFMGQVKMNTFIYGPKDDPYHHSKWRESYPAKEKEDFKELLAVAAANHVDFYWAIHLGGNFSATGPESERDFKLLFSKLAEMYDIGIRSFAVFFDDFGDRKAKNHAMICNRVVKEFLSVKGDCTRLIVCPHVYWGLGDNAYVRTLGKELDESVCIMWTGRSVCCDITPEDTASLTANQGREPFLWWNWPVNDYCRKKLLLGRTYGLSGKRFSGVVTNPMENCQANKIGIFGVADWAWNPDGFDSFSNWEAAFPFIYGDAAVARAMRTFAFHNSDTDRNGWKFRREESAGAEKRAEKEVFTELLEAVKVLEEKLPVLEKDLWFEVEGWVRCQKALVEMGLEALKGEEADIKKVARFRKDYLKAQDEHVAKFKAATFANDARRVKKPEPSTLFIAPRVDVLVEKAFASRWEKKTGRKYVRAEGFEGISTAKAFPRPVVTRDFKYAGFGPVFEPIVLEKGETIGVKLPADWKSDYVNLEISSSKGLVLEVSKDGSFWSEAGKLKPKGRTCIKLDKAGDMRYLRLRNASEGRKKFKLEVLEFFVRGEYSPVDLFVANLI